MAGEEGNRLRSKGRGREKGSKGVENEGEGEHLIELGKTSNARALSQCLIIGLCHPDHRKLGKLGMQPAKQNRTQGRVKLLGARVLA